MWHVGHKLAPERPKTCFIQPGSIGSTVSVGTVEGI